MLLHNYIFYNWLFRLKRPFKNIVFRGHAYRTNDRHHGQRLSISTNEKIITEHLIIQQIRYPDSHIQIFFSFNRSIAIFSSISAVISLSLVHNVLYNPPTTLPISKFFCATENMLKRINCSHKQNARFVAAISAASEALPFYPRCIAIMRIVYLYVIRHSN